jgi:hypothetical protein
MCGKPTTYDAWEYPLFQQMRTAATNQATLIAIFYAERVDLTYNSDQVKATDLAMPGLPSLTILAAALLAALPAAIHAVHR